MARNYPLNRIRYWYAYDIDEICGLYKDTKLHPQTVLGWIKAGLEVADNSKPFLIMGYHLSAFLGKRNIEGRHKTALHEIFCMTCQDIKKPYRGQVQIIRQGYPLENKKICWLCTIMFTQRCRTIVEKYSG